MNRFFVSSSCVSQGVIRIEGEDVKHITRVLRLGPGDLISVCDKEGTDYVCSIEETGKDYVLAAIVESKANASESNLDITLFQGVPKGDKMDYIIQKCVELGVSRVVPVVMKRTVVKLKDEDSKCRRWQRIAEEAAKQSGRGRIPRICPVTKMEDVPGLFQKDGLYILAYENEKESSLKEVLTSHNGADTIGIIIGPEGGFEEQEVSLCSQNGARVVTLGPRILRCETAPVAAVSAVMYELGDW